jgi:signal transduction histidine kinase
MADPSLLLALLLFLTTFFCGLWFVLKRLMREGRSHEKGNGKEKQSHGMPAERSRLVEFLQDDLGQRLAAARINLSTLRVRMRSDGVPEPDELGTAMKLLDEGCRDIRTVSRSIKKESKPGK